MSRRKRFVVAVELRFCGISDATSGGSAQEHVFSQNVQVIFEVNLVPENYVPAECFSQSLFRVLYFDTE